jgi:hypothetical protein
MGNYLNDEERQALHDRLADAEPMTAERAQWWYMVHNHWSEEAQERNKNKKPVSRYRRPSYTKDPRWPRARKSNWKNQRRQRNLPKSHRMKMGSLSNFARLNPWSLV